MIAYAIASLQFLLNFAWMLILMYGAFELALYVLSFCASLIASMMKQGRVGLVAQLKAAHAHAFVARKDMAFALV